MKEKNKGMIDQSPNQVITLVKGEEKGLKYVFILYFICWATILVPNRLIGFIGWVSMGMIGFSLYKIMSKLIDREVKNG